MEAVQAASEECLEYRPIDSSTQGLPDYSEALIHGASALRVLQGLAPFGKPMTPVGFGESANAGLAAEADEGVEAAMDDAVTQTAPIELSDPAVGAAELSGAAHSSGPDSCMFTTGRSAL